MSGKFNQLGQPIPQDCCDLKVYRRLNALREKGLNEMFFSLDDPSHQKEYQNIVAELGFYRLPYDVVELEGGVVILFFSGEVGNYIGIESRRNVLHQALNQGSKSN
jgi:hypothetical protein